MFNPTTPGESFRCQHFSITKHEHYLWNAVILSDYIANIPGEAGQSEDGKERGRDGQMRGRKGGRMRGRKGGRMRGRKGGGRIERKRTNEPKDKPQTRSKKPKT